MMDFTIANPVVAGESAGNDFVISSVVDPGARTCETRIELTGPVTATRSASSTGSTSTRTPMSVPLQDAGFAVSAVGEEYTQQPAEASTLRATWTRGVCRRDSAASARPL